MLTKLKLFQEKLAMRRYLSNQFTSLELRNHFLNRHAIDVGMYSYGCFDESRIAKGTKVGRYCSFANTVHIFNGNHGLYFLSTHPYLYNVHLGVVPNETIHRGKCVVEDDVWFGHSAIVLPHVTTIGRGSVIGAGSVVTRNIPRYAIVAGNPAKILRFRFSDQVIERIEASLWWEKSLDDLKEIIRTHPEMAFMPADYFGNNFAGRST